MTEDKKLVQRDRTFDIMKGIGILLMITCHYFNWNHPLLGKSINSFHMPMFFIVAGYFSKQFSTYSDAKLQIKKYARRLLPAALFTQTALIFWAILMALIKKGGWNPVIVRILSVFWADPHGPITQWGQLYIGVIWFLLALLIAKSLLLFLSRLNVWAIPISLVLAFGAILLYRLFPYSIWCISLGLAALPFVTIGWWFRSHRIPLSLIITCVLCWFIAIFSSELNMYGFVWNCYPLDVLGACGGTICLFFFSKLLNRFMKPIAFLLSILGIWSLAILCFHDLEINCHLGNHFMAFLPFALPGWGKYVFRYLITIVFAGISIKLPVLKKVFA